MNKSLETLLRDVCEVVTPIKCHDIIRVTAQYTCFLSCYLDGFKVIQHVIVSQ